MHEVLNILVYSRRCSVRIIQVKWSLKRADILKALNDNVQVLWYRRFDISRPLSWKRWMQPNSWFVIGRRCGLLFWTLNAVVSCYSLLNLFILRCSGFTFMCFEELVGSSDVVNATSIKRVLLQCKVQAWASAGGWGAKRAFSPPWKLGLRSKNFSKTWNQVFNSDYLD